MWDENVSHTECGVCLFLPGLDCFMRICSFIGRECLLYRNSKLFNGIPSPGQTSGVLYLSDCTCTQTHIDFKVESIHSCWLVHEIKLKDNMGN